MFNLRELQRKNFPNRESQRVVCRLSPTTCPTCPSTPSLCLWWSLSGTRSTFSWTLHYSLDLVVGLGEIDDEQCQITPSFALIFQMFSSALAHSQYYSTFDYWVSSCDMFILHSYILSATGK